MCIRDRIYSDKLISFDSPKNGRSMRTFGATKKSVFGQKSEDTRQKRKSVQTYHNSIKTKKFKMVSEKNTNSNKIESPKLLVPPGIPDFNLNSDSDKTYDGNVLYNDSLRSSKDIQQNRLFNKSINYKKSENEVIYKKKYSDTPKLTGEVFTYNSPDQKKPKENSIFQNLTSKMENNERIPKVNSNQNKTSNQCFLILENKSGKNSNNSSDLDFSSTVLPINQGSKRRVKRRLSRAKGKNKKKLKSMYLKIIRIIVPFIPKIKERLQF